ncbi:MAG TPA: BON domain-containing protein [Candidatus Polarisedimenticolia bacterium]|nr:BON domain-containing protein [Candidatus Polarisedimenticolia bacterium]
MKKSMVLCGGLGAGAAMMYLLDPDVGRRRRARLRDQFFHSRRLLREAGYTTGRDIRNRAVGIWASLLSFLRGETGVPDRVLEDRVRSRLGRVVTHPSWIRVKADEGHVSVTGHVPRREKDRLHAVVASVRGVRDVDEHDLVVDEDRDVPGEPPGWNATGYWPPAWRFVAGAAGAGLGAYGMGRQDVFGKVLALAGLGLALRGLLNVSPGEVRDILASSGSREAAAP